MVRVIKFLAYLVCALVLLIVLVICSMLLAELLRLFL